MNREEHLQWCKERAMEYVKSGDYEQAVTSIMSDLGKHPDTARHSGIMLGTMLLMTGNLSTQRQVEEFIQGFN